MGYKNFKISPEFRHLTDLLFFSENPDIDSKKFLSLYKENKYSIDYIYETFIRAVFIYWEDGETFWTNKLKFLFSLNDKRLSKWIEGQLESNFRTLIINKPEIKETFDVEVIQYYCLCKIKHGRRENMRSIRSYFIDVINKLSVDKTIKIVKYFMPYVFKDIDDYISEILVNIGSYYRNYIIIQKLEEQGYKIDKEPFIKATKNIISNKNKKDYNSVLAFFKMIEDPIILDSLKNEYKISDRKHLIELVNAVDIGVLEENFFENMKNLLKLDPGFLDKLFICYLDDLYDRYFNHKKARVDRIVKLLNIFPDMPPKKVFAYLSNNGKLDDINFMIKQYPDLKKLRAFA